MKTLFQADESFCTYLESGMPIGLRSQIEDGYLGDWYKSCYHTLHKNFGRDYKSNYDDFYNSFFSYSHKMHQRQIMKVTNVSDLI